MTRVNEQVVNANNDERRVSLGVTSQAHLCHENTGKPFKGEVLERQLLANTFLECIDYSCAGEGKQGSDFIYTVFRRGEKYFVNVLATSCLSVSPSVRMENLGFHWKKYLEICYLNIFGKSVERVPVSSNSDKNNGYFT
jgi:hypothetical protein